MLEFNILEDISVGEVKMLEEFYCEMAANPKNDKAWKTFMPLVAHHWELK